MESNLRNLTTNVFPILPRNIVVKGLSLLKENNFYVLINFSSLSLPDIEVTQLEY